VTDYIVVLANNRGEMAVQADSVATDGGSLKFSRAGTEALVFGAEAYTAWRAADVPGCAGIMRAKPAIQTPGPTRSRARYGTNLAGKLFPSGGVRPAGDMDAQSRNVGRSGSGGR
jgi:hypothetical protein